MRKWVAMAAGVVSLLGSTQVLASGLAPHFHGRFGAIEIFDSQAKLSFRVNPPRLTTPLPVCATGNLAIATVALKQGILNPQSSERPWDAVRFPAAADWPRAWQRPQTLESALRNGAPWYFEALKTELGAALPTQLTRLKLKFSGDTASWRSSALDQVEWLKAVRSNAPGLSPVAHAALLKALERGQLEGRTLYGLGGRCAQDAEYWLGWQIGWVDRPIGPVFYALNTEGKDRADLNGVTRMIARGALAEMKFFPLDPVPVTEVLAAGGPAPAGGTEGLPAPKAVEASAVLVPK